MLEPALVSAPLVGVAPRASGGACVTAVDPLRVGALGFGIVIAGALAAGGRIGSGFLISSGVVIVCTGLPEIDVMPPADGPGVPAARLIVITSRGVSTRWASHREGTRTAAATIAPC